MKKAFTTVILCLLLLALLAGCQTGMAGTPTNAPTEPIKIAWDQMQTPEGYDLVRDEAGWYIVLDGYDYEDCLVGFRIVGVSFNSFEEMCMKLATGDFTEQELCQIGAIERNEDGNIPVCDMDRLYQPIGVTEHIIIDWQGPTYVVSLYDGDINNSSNLMGAYGYLEKEEGNQMAYEFLNDFDRSPEVNMEFVPNYDPSLQPADEQIETIEDRNATVIIHKSYHDFFTSDYKLVKEIIYSWEVDGSVYIVREFYDSPEATIPSRMVLLCQAGDVYGYFQISKMQQRYSIEEMSTWTAEYYAGPQP